jgi:branched-chain amino acid transport system permease protein
MTRAGAIAVVICAVAAIVAPFFLKPFGIFLISTWVVLTIAAIGLNLTLGYAGQISLAQGAFVGLGAYTVALLTPLGVPFFAAFFAAGLLCFAVGWVLGYPALRVQHHYLAFVTLAFTTLVFLVLRNEEWLTNGIYGITGTPRPTLFGWKTGGARDFSAFLRCFRSELGGCFARRGAEPSLPCAKIRSVRYRSASIHGVTR